MLYFLSWKRTGNTKCKEIMYLSIVKTDLKRNEKQKYVLISISTLIKVYMCLCFSVGINPCANVFISRQNRFNLMFLKTLEKLHVYQTTGSLKEFSYLIHKRLLT